MNTILLTGFKPFGYHFINSSEILATIIGESGLDAELNVNLVTEILEVSYTKALDRLVQLWAEHNPFLVVHLGVHRRDFIKIENRARKHGYTYRDHDGFLLRHEVCPVGEEPIICTKLDTKRVIENCMHGGQEICLSEDAGQFLCEFVYYISLSHDPAKVLFIHVPPYEQDSSTQENALIIKDIIKDLYEQRLNMQ